ncbi:MAG: TorF family putative porin [Janthinobacterium lividum]
MRGSRWVLLVGMLVAGPAGAQTAPPAPVTVSGSATLVTDYRLRGLSQSDRDPAVQTGITVDTLAGIYAGVWASTIGSYVARGADAEVDLTVGYRRTVAGTMLDGGVLYYVRPGSIGSTGTYLEPYLNVSKTYGPVAAKIGGNVAWRQSGLGFDGDRRGGVYAYGELAAGIPRTPLTVTAHVGHSFARNLTTFGQTYTDWSLTGAYTVHAVTISASYVDTDTRVWRHPTGGAHDGDIAGAGLVGSIALAF